MLSVYLHFLIFCFYDRHDKTFFLFCFKSLDVSNSLQRDKNVDVPKLEAFPEDNVDWLSPLPHNPDF